jgi:hypothetical protein
LATIYSDLAGTPLAQPVVTDGFGHSDAYMDDSALYTVVFFHPLFGANPVALKDQRLGGSGGGGGGGSVVTAFAGIPQGTIDGVNRAFTLTNAGIPLTVFPTQATVWFNFPLVPGLGYTLTGVTIIYANPPQPASGGSPADAIYAEGFTIS